MKSYITSYIICFCAVASAFIGVGLFMQASAEIGNLNFGIPTLVLYPLATVAFISLAIHLFVIYGRIIRKP